MLREVRHPQKDKCGMTSPMGREADLTAVRVEWFWRGHRRAAWKVGGGVNKLSKEQEVTMCCCSKGWLQVMIHFSNL